MDIPRRYKLKEHFLRDFLKDEFKNVEMVFDKQVDGGCSRYRPDVRIECLTHTVIIECDENKHQGYSCEEKRIMGIFNDLGNRPLVVIRFNPDSNSESEGCFKLSSKTQQLSLNKKEWNKRTAILKIHVSGYLNSVPKKEVTIEYIFY